MVAVLDDAVGSVLGRLHDYRGLEQILEEWAELRDVLGLAEVSDHSTIQKAAERLLEEGGPPTSSGGRCAARGHAA